jgi:hypothetical protein
MGAQSLQEGLEIGNKATFEDWGQFISGVIVDIATCEDIPYYLIDSKFGLFWVAENDIEESNGSAMR